MRRVLVLGALLASAAAAQDPALRKGVSVQMPDTKHAVAVPDADQAGSLVVAITLRGTVYLEVTNVTPAQLSEKVKSELQSHPGKRVYLKSDARTPYSRVAEVLGALGKAGVAEPILLTSQHESTEKPPVPPKGVEVAVAAAPAGTPAVTLPASETDLTRGKAVLLHADGKTPYGDVVHAIDICRGAGVKVYLQ